jgi:hypothetical protein
VTAIHKPDTRRQCHLTDRDPAIPIAIRNTLLSTRDPATNRSKKTGIAISGAQHHGPATTLKSFSISLWTC